MMMARVRRVASLRLAARIALAMGMKKQSDLPDPVPVVTT